MYGPTLSDEEFEMQGQFFRTALSNGEEVDLCAGGSEKPVTKANLQEFVQLFQQKRFKESEQAIKFIREGLRMVVGDKMTIFDFCSW